VAQASPSDSILFLQAQIGLVDESRGLEGVAWTLVRQVPTGQPSQLIVDERQKGRSDLLGALSLAAS
jgi:hypothetical protein